MPQADTPTRTAERRIVLDLDRCVGCKTCAAACAHSHHRMPTVQHAQLAVAALPLLCRHCEAAPCVDACPSGAMERDESGAVRRSMLMCWSCGSCVLACPFGVLPTDLTQRVVAKCDLCEGLTHENGRPRGPACVAACPTGALQFVSPDEAAASDLLLIGGRASGRNPFRRR